MTLMVFVRVGSRYEPVEINGASHFIEHLMFKGTKRRPNTLAISKELDRYGAEYNAFTGKDLTAYYVKMDAEQTPLAIDLLHDMLTHSLYDSKEIERERGVIVEEINMYEDHPQRHVEDLLEQELFQGNSLGRSIAGPRETIRSVLRESLVDYRDKYYIPSRMTVVVAGRIHPKTKTLLKETFGKIPVPTPSRDLPFETFSAPKQLQDPLGFQAKKTEQVQLSMAFYGAPYGDATLPALSLLASILGGTMSSRLFIEVRERRGLCYSIHASHESLEDTGIFGISAGLDKARLEEAVRVVWHELERMKKELVDREELKRAKDHIRGKWMLAFEDSANQADWYGRQLVFEKKMRTPEERLKKLIV